MNGTVIDIPGISVKVTPITLLGSTDEAHLVTISDGTKEIIIDISYGRIEEVRSRKYKQ